MGMIGILAGELYACDDDEGTQHIGSRVHRVGDHRAGMREDTGGQLEDRENQVSQDGHHRYPHSQLFIAFFVHKCYLLKWKDSSYGTSPDLSVYAPRYKKRHLRNIRTVPQMSNPSSAAARAARPHKPRSSRVYRLLSLYCSCPKGYGCSAKRYFCNIIFTIPCQGSQPIFYKKQNHPAD